MGELRQATDAEVMGWAATKYLEDYSEDVVITDLEDAGRQPDDTETLVM